MPRNRVETKHLVVILSGLLTVVVIVGLTSILVLRAHSSASPDGASSRSPITRQEIESGIDPGSSLHGAPAPDFTLTDQFGRQVSLRQLRGKVVILAFTDSQCTTICPLTSQSLLEALRLLPTSAAQHVQLLGIDANPDALSMADVRTYSIGHGLENKWRFLTGSAEQVKQVWKAYGVDVQIVKGAIDHTPAVFVLDAQGREQQVFLTSGQYGVVAGEAFALADTVAPLLPGHVQPPTQFPVERQLSTTTPITLPTMTPNGQSGTVTLGPGQAQLLFFLASWAPDIQAELEALNTVAQTPGNPRVIAGDIGSTEPSPTAAQTLLSSLPTPLVYPVAYDALGDIADTYLVQDVPWFALISASGALVGSHDGWEATTLIQQGIQQTLQQQTAP
ncbi:MAG: SCO family protein [Ktedonobacterales bacterium]